MERVHREPLQPRNLNRLLVVPVHHAGPFAQHLYRARPGTTGAKNIRIKDRARGAREIAAGNFLDEARHIDMRRTSRRAGSVETDRGSDLPQAPQPACRSGGCRSPKRSTTSGRGVTCS